MKWEMEIEDIEAVLENIWDLHDKLSDAIHSISRSHYLHSINSLRKSAKKKSPPTTTIRSPRKTIIAGLDSCSRRTTLTTTRRFNRQRALTPSKPPSSRPGPETIGANYPNQSIDLYCLFSLVRPLPCLPLCETANPNFHTATSRASLILSESLQMFKDMYVQGFAAKPELIASVLSACVQTGDFGVGRDIHALVVDFERMEVKNELSWTAMISGCAACQNYGIALDCFRAMQVEGIKPNRVTLVTILPRCIELGCLRHGKEIHVFAFRRGFNYEILRGQLYWDRAWATQMSGRHCPREPRGPAPILSGQFSISRVFDNLWLVAEKGEENVMGAKG
ncbi:plastid division1 [Actinidia rufa]|uniref:Plastid division1 n=1 Tax=Actinidia rufa TaxID=165716 RepID=A0A7J0E6G1_9ERIC|nr:plastid division1 [Actinidia rufa]